MTAKSTKKSSGAGRASSRKTVSGKPASAKKSAAKKSTASGKKAQSGAKASSGKREKAVQPQQYEERTNPLLYYEIFLWVMLAVSVFLFISLIGVGGFLGEAVRSFCFGCFGILAYLLPFLLFFVTAFLISNRTSHIAKIKAASTGGLYLVTCGFMELILLGYTDGYRLSEYYQAGVRYRTGGGLVGGVFVNLFCPAIGVAGAYVMLVIMAIICIVLITQRSLFSDMKRKSSRMYRSAREGQARRKEQERLRQEQSYFYELPGNFPENAEGSRLTRRVSGVTSNTDLSGQPRIPSDEVLQVLPKTTEETLNVPPVVNFTAVRPDGYQSLDQKEEKEKKPEKTKEPEFEPDELTIEGLREPDLEENEEPEPADPPRVPADELSAPKKGNRKPRSSQAEIRQGIENVEQEIEKTTAETKQEYIFPPLQLLNRPSGKRAGAKDTELRETAQKLQQILQTFGVHVKVTNASCGPSVTRYELMPEMGVKVSKIVNLADDIKLNLAAADIRIEAPIPGKAAVGIEVPNKESSGVLLRELLESEEFKNHPSNLAYAVGKDIAGKIVVADIAKMPHLLIAGATGSGKSVFINTLIMSIIYKAKPEDVKMIMIDPKVVELSVYNGIPHLFIPVVTDPKKAAGALNWGVSEMMKRYELFASMGVRDLKGYNARVEAVRRDTVPAEGETLPEKMPQVVIIVDELADLMMVASGEVEDAICRLAQLARAAGIHLVIATQRPSVDVITGLIKANMPSRIAFSVSSGVDSRTILDMNGAEKLLGNGDMLFAPQTYKKPARIQGAFVSDKEVSDVVEFLKEKNTDGEQYKKQMEEQIAQVQKSAGAAASSGSDVDELFADAGKFIIEKDKASIGMLQRWFKIGFNRAARIMDQLSEAGVVGPEEGTKPRKVLMSMEQFENYLEEN